MTSEVNGSKFLNCPEAQVSDRRNVLSVWDNDTGRERNRSRSLVSRPTVILANVRLSPRPARIAWTG